MENHFIGYPFQMNIRGLKRQTVYDCVSGAVRAAFEWRDLRRPRNLMSRTRHHG